MLSRYFFGLFLLSSLMSQAVAEVVTFGIADASFDIEFVDVGDPGNPMDDAVSLHKQEFPIGAVDYAYSIAKFEISREMIEKANLSAGLAVEITLPDFSWLRGGPRPEMPATGVSWREAARFVNWLNTSVGYAPAYKIVGPGSDVFEMWQQGDLGFDPENPFRNSEARFVLPSAHEWHKAAFYDPSLMDGDGGYWDYPTGSDEPPVPTTGGTEQGTAVYRRQGSGPADIENAGGLNPYGIMAMGGNARELEETAFDLVNSVKGEDRGVRSGSWAATDLKSSIRAFESIGGENDALGFRVAMLPDAEPGDFDRDGSIASADMDFLSERVRSSTVEAIFDLNGDLAVNQLDREIWVTNVVGSHFGDADLNGTVDFDDFALLSASFNQSAGWTGGDFDGSGTTDFDDFVLFSNNFGKGAVAEPVPEPSAQLLCFLGLTILVFRRRR